MIQTNKPTQEEINSVIVKILNEKIAQGINGYNKVDETTNKFLNLTLNYTYFLLSIDAACIAFIISLTVHAPIIKADWLLVISLLFWVTSFLAGLFKISRLLSIMNSFTYYIFGESQKLKEVSEQHKEAYEKLLKEDSKAKNSPLAYFLFGIIVFICWYFIKILLR